MRTTSFVLLLMGVVAAFCVTAAPSSVACSQPGTLTISYTWGANKYVGLLNNNVPSSPVGTAVTNWNNALATASGGCAPIIQYGGTSIVMSFSS
jgi:hypothetical protein